MLARGVSRFATRLALADERDPPTPHPVSTLKSDIAERVRARE